MVESKRPDGKSGLLDIIDDYRDDGIGIHSLYCGSGDGRMKNHNRSKAIRKLQRRTERHWAALLDLVMDFGEAEQLFENEKDRWMAHYLALKCEDLANLIGRTYGW